MKNLTFLLIFFLGLKSLQAQTGVGIGTDEPDDSAVLHVYSSDGSKGLLIPETDDLPTFGTGSADANGLLIYDKTNNRYAYLRDDEWVYVNPWDTQPVPADGSISSISTDASVGINLGGAAPSEQLHVGGNIRATGDISADNVTASDEVSATSFVGRGTIPIGAIIMWSGSTVPTNYRLCNGSNGTPDLRNRFIRGSTSSSGSAGGSDIVFSQSGTEYSPSLPGCSPYTNTYEWSNIQPCLGPGATNCFNYGGYGATASSVSQAQSFIIDAWIINGMETVVFPSSPTVNANPQYYDGNPDCLLLETLDYYRLAFIMRYQ